MFNLIKQNRELKAFIREITLLLNSAERPDDLYQLVGRFKTYNKPLEYTNDFNHILFVLLLPPLFFVILVYHQFDSVMDGLFVLLDAAIILYSCIHLPENVIDELSEKVMYKKVLFDNQLKAVDCQNDSFTKNLMNRFGSFMIGHCDRKIEEYCSGRHEGRSYSFSYDYFK